MNLTPPAHLADDWTAYSPDNRGDFGDGTYWEIEDGFGHVATVYGEGQEVADHAKQIQAIPKIIDKLRQLADCNLNEDNCASFEVTNRRIRRLVTEALLELGFTKQ